jgi:hypothetical protein
MLRIRKKRKEMPMNAERYAHTYSLLILIFILMIARRRREDGEGGSEAGEEAGEGQAEGRTSSSQGGRRRHRVGGLLHPLLREVGLQEVIVCRKSLRRPEVTELTPRTQLA